MAIRDTTQIGQPVPPTPPLPSQPATVPEKLLKAFPQFKDYYDDSERRYKQLVQAIRATADDLALPLSAIKKNVPTNSAEYKNNNSFLTVTIKAIADAVSASIERITVLEASVSGTGTIRTFFQDTAPTEPPVIPVGSLWFQTPNPIKMYRWDGSTWVRADSSDIEAAIARITIIEGAYVTLTTASTMVSTAQAAAVASAQGYTDGQILSLASIYATQTSVTTQISTAQSAAVTSANGYTNGQIATLASIYATQTSVTSQISTAQSAAVTTANSYTNAQIATTNTAWAAGDAALASAILALSAASGNHIYRQATAPTSPNDGDYWIDTAHGNIPYVYDLATTSWVSVRDTDLIATLGTVSTLSSVYATISSVTTQIATAQSAAVVSAASYTDGQISSLASIYATQTSVTSQISTAQSAAVSTANTYTNGQISSLSSVYATPSSVTSTVTSMISASISSGSAGTIGAAINTEASARVSADGAIHAKWGVAINVNGNIVGKINLDGTNQSSSLSIAVDKFTVANATTGLVPFQIVGTKARFTSDVEIDGSLLISGSLTVGQVSGALAAGGAAADVNAGVTTINGGRITANSITVSQIDATSVLSNSVVIGSGGTQARIENGKIQQGFFTVEAHVTGSPYTQMSLVAGGGSIQATALWNPGLPAVLYGVDGGGTTQWSLPSSGNCSMNNLTTGQINSSVGDGRTVPMFTGSNNIQTAWSGSDFQLWIDGTHVGNIQYV